MATTEFAAVTTNTDLFTEAIIGNYVNTGVQLDYSTDEVRAAFAPSREADAEAILTVNGLDFESLRYQVGALTPRCRSRGGCEFTHLVTAKKIADKALLMFAKHTLGNTGNVGAKSGIRAASEEVIEALEPEDRRQLFAQHARAHHINPMTNVVAMDIGTTGADMDAIAEALTGKYCGIAGAAASGASQKYGGEPELHAPRTGQGASIMLDRYLHERAKTDPRVAEAINGGRPLRVLVQGLGKAGRGFVETMPTYVQLAGALEANGAIVTENSNQTLNGEAVLELARDTKFSEASIAPIEKALWLDPSARSEFWAQPGVDIIAPAFDRDQFTAEDARAFGGIAVLGIANHPVDEQAQAILSEREIDELPDVVANVGGTISSQKIWDKIMGLHPDWTPEIYEASWQHDMLTAANTLLERRAQEAAERDTFVSFQKTSAIIIVERAVQRLRTAR